MHVAYLLSDLGGGTGQHLLAMLERRADDWSAEILSEVESTVGADFPVSHAVLPEPPGTARYPFLQVRRYLQIERYFDAARSARSAAADTVHAAVAAPDVLHTYFFWSIVYGRLLKARGRIPLLVENREDLGFNWGRHEYALLALTRSLPDRIVCVCDAVREVVLEREGVEPHRVSVIRNGIEARPERSMTIEQARAELGISAGRPVIGMVANFDRPVKGASYFIRAIPRILERVPGAQFFLIGAGRQEGELREQAARLGVADSLTLTGFVADVDRYYAAMDVSVLTSLAEGLSLTLLESMSWGLPVVATRVGGNPEVVLDGQTGVLVPPRDVEAFSGAVVALLEDPAERKRLGRAAIERARGEFAIERTVREYRELYRTLAR